MGKAINQETMRNTNKIMIFKCIKESSGASKKDIGEKLGLSTTTVASFINELIVEDKIYSSGSAKSTGGRRSILYRVNPTAGYSLGIDVQIDRLVLVLLNFAGDLVSAKEIDLDTKNEWAVASVLNQVIPAFVAEHHLPVNKLLGIGLGIPGIVNRESGLINFAPNLEWENVNLRPLIKHQLPIIIENEANAAALGEKAFGVGRNVSNMIYVSIGIGVGCGIIIENNLFSGVSFNAGEFGHMTVEPDGFCCKCGKKGCWEMYASNNAALNLYKVKSGLVIYKYEDYIRKVLAGDKVALEVADYILKYLGVGIGNIINGLNPQLVVIGGKIAETKDLLYDKLLQQIKCYTLGKSLIGLEIAFSTLNNKASAMGAAGMVLEKAMETL